ncbi:tetratricopeptide repeat protein [Citrobacter enshiensis]|uniref:tetratricopeptide repeat protein n=1 Tax=Citrobacter enshiensis TaxID=2971264 RepID=UPI0023E7D772|nr:tetratricopeptide repeat protein [Citrobacter enshiensis]WET41555.1 tetratricopeptide repeat protein [Citrobacter enshiensis]
MKKIILFALLILQIPITGYSAAAPSIDDLIQAEKRYSQTKQDILSDTITKAQSGDIESQKVLGLLYNEGTTGVINRDKAIYWFNLAANRGDAAAEFYLGLISQKGDKNTPPDYQNAITWYEKAANQGNIQAQVNCANIYQFGPKEFQNLDKAKFWLTKAAEKGDPIAHANLGIIASVAENYEEAASHLKFAAEKGDRIGQYNYGTLFLAGSGVPEDMQQAKYWFEKSAAQNLPDAQISLGRIYAWGFDVKGVDKEKALYWLNKAKAEGAISDEKINAIMAKKLD